MPRSGTTAISARARDRRRTLAAFAGGRVLGNVFIRFPYVLITPISEGLGIPLGATTAVLGVRELGGLATPVAGHLADRGHERRTVVGSGLVLGATCIGVAAGGGLGLFALLMVMGGAAKMFLDTGQTTWIGRRIPFTRRGRVIGLMEVTWAGAFLVGVPLCAWLTDRFGWRAPFLAVGLATAGVALLTGAVMGRGRTAGPVAAPVVATWRWRPPPGWWGIYVFAFLQAFAQMSVFAVAGDWFLTELGMSLGGLGWNTVLIGLGELSGALASAMWADRVGTRRAAMWGTAAAAPIALGLLAVGDRAVVGVALVVAFAAALELSFVSALSLATEVAPESRGTALGSILAVLTLSRAVASVVAGPLYVGLGIAGVAVVAGATATGAWWALWRGAREPAR